MDFGKLSQAEKLAVYGAVAAIVGGVIGALGGLIWLAVLAAIAMLVVIFLPQLSADTQLPGSRGSLMLICGGVAAVAALLALLTFLGGINFWFRIAPVETILFLIGVAGSLLMGWAGWQAFQAEGGKFTVGSSASGTARSEGETTTAREEPAAAQREERADARRDEPAPTAARDDAGVTQPGSTADAPPPGTADQERRDPPA